MGHWHDSCRWNEAKLIGIPCLVMLLGGRARLNQLEPGRLHNLGPVLGPICNIVACFFTLQAIVIYCLPAVLPVTVTI